MLISRVNKIAYNITLFHWVFYMNVYILFDYSGEIDFLNTSLDMIHKA